MKICSCCGNPVNKNGYHEKCLRKLFGVSFLPKINFTLQEVSIIAQKMVGKLSISGVQPKLSMKLNRKSRELEVVAEGGEYILKPQTQTFPNLPQNEDICTIMAEKTAIDVPPHALIELKDGSIAYIVKRFDRLKEEKIHLEDFYQILGKEDKYKGSNEEIGKKIWDISDVPGLDVQLFYERVLFYFIIGNGDAHFKNYSMIYTDEGRLRLSPAYDILSSKLVIPEEEDCALTINGKKNNITAKDFCAFRNYLQIPEKAVENKIIDQKNIILEMVGKSTLSVNEKKELTAIIKNRIDRVAQ